MATATKKKSTSRRKKPEPVEVTFEFERSTKRTHRFTEVGNSVSDEAVVGTLYVQQSAFDGDAPESITVTISF
jgi:hypothetical protein